MKKRLLTIVVILILPVVAEAGNQEIRRFSKIKKKSTTHEAYRRAEQRFQKVEIGMNQAEFFEVMEMVVIARNGKPVDAAVDGYLPESSRRLAHSGIDGRVAVFGYSQGDREVSKILVIFKDGLVNEIRSLDPEYTIASANGVADPAR